MSERLIRMLRARVAPSECVADAELLARWAGRRDESAFELLLRRHAEPVWRTCRAVAGEAAEDAFQATFLALARRAGAVRGNVPGWLHRVARHASLRARRARSGSLPVTQQATALTGSVAGPEGLHPPLASETAEIVAVLHAELARLPAAYREPVLLCHLYGRTQAQAAIELGLPPGTIATRVRRGCDRLRVALTRRGLAPNVHFGPPLVLPVSLVPAALGIGLGASAASPAIQTLATGALSAMSQTKLKVLAAVVAVGCAVTGGAMLARPPAVVESQPPSPPPAVARWEARPSDFFDRRDSINHLKPVLLAHHRYLDANGETLPRDIVSKDGKPLLSWRVVILPYIEQEVLYSMFKLDEPWDSPTNKPLMKHVPSVYRSAGAGPGLTRVKMFRGAHAVYDPTKPISMLDITDGTSNTVGVVEAGEAVEWTRPGDLEYASDKPLPDLSGPFTDGYAAGLMDGSVRWLDRRMNEKQLRLLIERDDGTPFNSDDLVPPAVRRPLTERERKQAAQWLTVLERGQEYDQLTHDQLVAVTVAAAKLGPVPLPTTPASDDLYRLEQALNERFQHQAYARNETERLLKLLKEKDPEAADRIEKEFTARWNAMLEKQRKAPQKK